MVNEIVCIQLQSFHLYDFSKAVLQGISEKKINETSDKPGWLVGKVGRRIEYDV